MTLNEGYGHRNEKRLYRPLALSFFHQVMHDEVSETENIRKNLAIERMIIEGCDILLDVNQTFVRQGQSAYCVCPLGVRLCVYVLSVV